MVASVRRTLRDIDAGITPVDIQTMEQRVSESTSRRRFQTALLVSFAVLAVSLALVGLYGLLSYSVNQRAPEIGVRMALGATRPTVLFMVMRWGLTLTAAGLGFGLASAFAVTRFTASMLYGVIHSLAAAVGLQNNPVANIFGGNTVSSHSRKPAVACPLY